jgi:hypothetical protein
MTVKRTFSLPDDVSGQLDEAAGGNASAYVAEAVRSRLARDAAAAALREAYGEPDPAAYAYWMGQLTRPLAVGAGNDAAPSEQPGAAVQRAS